MDIMDFFKSMGLDNKTYFKKNNDCNCVFTCMHLKGNNGFDRVVGSGLNYVCEECFTNIDEKEFEKRQSAFEKIVSSLPRKEFMKTQEELNKFFFDNNLDDKKMMENSHSLNEKINKIHLDSVHVNENDQENPSITLNLREEKRK